MLKAVARLCSKQAPQETEEMKWKEGDGGIPALLRLGQSTVDKQVSGREKRKKGNNVIVRCHNEITRSLLSGIYVESARRTITEMATGCYNSKGLHVCILYALRLRHATQSKSQ